MNTDIRLYVTFKGHRKRRRLRALLGDNSTDYLIDLWLSAAQDRPKGILTGWKREDIALSAGWEGDAGAFTDALIEAGLLEMRDGVYALHDWEEHQPWACKAEERSMIGSHAAGVRYKDKHNAQRMQQACSEHAGSIETAMPNACSMHAPARASSPSPSPSPSPIPEDMHSPIPEESDNKHFSRKDIFDHWNEARVIQHRTLSDKLKRAINGALATYSEDEIIQGIDNYAWILGSPKHYFKFRWTLADFLQRGLDKFLDRRVCDENYTRDRNDNGKGSARQLPTQYTPSRKYDSPGV